MSWGIPLVETYSKYHHKEKEAGEGAPNQREYK